MIPLGYMYKRVASRSESLKAPAAGPNPPSLTEWFNPTGVLDVYSLADCISSSFADYIDYWRHNGWWLFDSPEIMQELAEKESIDLAGTTLFYYEAYELEYDDDRGEWSPFSPEASFTTEVRQPAARTLEGFDVATFSMHNMPESSPLSCNSLAETISVNEHCLFRTFEQAKDTLERGTFKHSEPGAFRIIGVYTI